MLTQQKGLGFNDVLARPCPSDISSRKEVNLERKFPFGTYLPLIAANMGNIGTWKVAKVLAKFKIMTCLTNFLDLRLLNKEEVKYAIPSFKLNAYPAIDLALNYHGLPVICLDVANGYMKQFIDYVITVRKMYPSTIIMAGNVATWEGAQNLYLAGADIVKVGLGSGSVCTTRYKTGVGVPQISAIDEVVTTCAKQRYICSDGGCTSPGDVAKAFIAGADFVMLGGMLAGTTETGSVFSGSAFGNSETYKTSEGKTVNLGEPVQSLGERVEEILGGLRSCGSYIGQRNISDFYKGELMQVTEQTNNWLGPPS